MKFEEALSAMREGKKVKRCGQSLPRCLHNNKIYEIWKDEYGSYKCDRLDYIYCDNILAEDWEVVEDE